MMTQQHISDLLPESMPLLQRAWYTLIQAHTDMQQLEAGAPVLGSFLLIHILCNLQTGGSYAQLPQVAARSSSRGFSDCLQPWWPISLPMFKPCCWCCLSPSMRRMDAVPMEIYMLS